MMTNLHPHEGHCDGKCLDCIHYGVCAVVDGLRKLNLSTSFQFDCAFLQDDAALGRALALLREAADGALDGSDILEAASIMVSQRDNARVEAQAYKEQRDAAREKALRLDRLLGEVQQALSDLRLEAAIRIKMAQG